MFDTFSSLCVALCRWSSVEWDFLKHVEVVWVQHRNLQQLSVEVLSQRLYQQVWWDFCPLSTTREQFLNIINWVLSDALGQSSSLQVADCKISQGVFQFILIKITSSVWDLLFATYLQYILTKPVSAASFHKTHYFSLVLACELFPQKTPFACRLTVTLKSRLI